MIAPHPPDFTETALPGCPFDMVFVEGGTFTMGDDESEYEREKHAHPVTLRSFYLARLPVTQRLWMAVMDGENPSYFTGNDLRPVESVSWDDIVETFLPRLNDHFVRSGAPYRLPTDTTALKAQIDRLVYSLYGLTEEEIRVVEGGSPNISEENLSVGSLRSPGGTRVHERLIS